MRVASEDARGASGPLARPEPTLFAMWDFPLEVKRNTGGDGASRQRRGVDVDGSAEEGGAGSQATLDQRLDRPLDLRDLRLQLGVVIVGRSGDPDRRTEPEMVLHWQRDGNQRGRDGKRRKADGLRHGLEVRSEE